MLTMCIAVLFNTSDLNEYANLSFIEVASPIAHTYTPAHIHPSNKPHLLQLPQPFNQSAIPLLPNCEISNFVPAYVH